MRNHQCNIKENRKQNWAKKSQAYYILIRIIVLNDEYALAACDDIVPLSVMTLSRYLNFVIRLSNSTY